MAARPTTYSVTRIEKLIRDSYHVYAQQIIKLIPLDSIGQDVDARLHGSLIHTALQEWTAALKHVPESEHLHLLLLKGREAFAPFMEFPEVNRFWWPRFERMAAEFIMVDAELRGNIIGTLTEISGHYNFSIENVNYLLTARADRIDILQNGGLRIIDYKSGKVPSGKQMASGFAPQLTLEALIATQGSFKQVHSKHVDDVLYCAVGGGNQEVKFTGLAKGNSISEEIAKTKLGLMSLLLGFQNPQTAFLPRINMEKDSDVSDYDHLSRKLEWQLEGTTF
jgi:ATP-dependent helicase/nuclease subunit B